MSHRPKSAYFLRPGALEQIYSPAAQRRIQELTNPYPVQLTQDNWQEHLGALKEVKYLLSGWGMSALDTAFLLAAPELEHIFYGSGSVRGFYTDAARERGIGVSSAWRANAVPTAEFAHATIVLSLKKYWRAQRTAHKERIWSKPAQAAGIYGSTVGIVSLGAIGSRVARSLASNHALNVIAYDPFVDATEMLKWGIQLVDLETLFATSDVISLHTPDLESTKHLIDRKRLLSMKTNATLINTARGEVIDEPALIEVLQKRTDLDAVLDVTATEPENADSPLWELPNVTITPHIAGSLNRECQRMGEYMVQELERYLSGLPLQHEVTPGILTTMA